MILGTGVRREPNQGYIKTWPDVFHVGAFSVISVLLLCLCVNSWGACNTFSVNCLNTSCPYCKGGYCFGATGAIQQNGSMWSLDYAGACNLASGNGHAFAVEVQHACDGQPGIWEVTNCDTQTEADSVACVSQGNTWIPEHQNSQGVTIPGKCQEPVVQDSTTLNNVTQACNALDGTPNYHFNDNGNVVGYCDMCQTDENGNYTNIHVSEMWNDQKKSCCEVGKAPNKEDFKCLATANACVGDNCDWTINPQAKGGGIGMSEVGFKSGICAVNVSANPSTGVIAGCEDEEPNSSDSQNSSDSSSPSSGSSGSGEGEGSSTSTEQQIADGVGAIIDSLHKIIVIDSMNRTYDSLVAVFVSTIAATNDEINTKLDNIGSDTNIVNVNVQGDTNIIHVGAPDVDVQGMIDAIVASAAVDSQNGVTLDSMLKCIADRGSSCFIGDTTQPYSDSNIVNILTDTSGQSYGDTAGWGSKLDSFSNWLADSTFLRGIFGGKGDALCDTTGGKKCASMGGSLDSAGGSWGSTYKALGDSLTEGAVGDSLRHWESMLTNNGVITGSGSNACPSVFSRQFEINIGQSISVQTPALGQYICANIPGTGVTFWTLARVVIRAMVAITCMWWLYGAVTGVKNDGGDDD